MTCQLPERFRMKVALSVDHFSSEIATTTAGPERLALIVKQVLWPHSSAGALLLMIGLRYKCDGDPAVEYRLSNPARTPQVCQLFIRMLKLARFGHTVLEQRGSTGDGTLACDGDRMVEHGASQLGLTPQVCKFPSDSLLSVSEVSDAWYPDCVASRG